MVLYFVFWYFCTWLTSIARPSPGRWGSTTGCSLSSWVCLLGNVWSINCYWWTRRSYNPLPWEHHKTAVQCMVLSYKCIHTHTCIQVCLWMRMQVCVCGCVCVSVSAHASLCVFVCACSKCTQFCVCVRLGVCVCVCVWICVCVCVCMFVWICVWRKWLDASKRSRVHRQSQCGLRRRRRGQKKLQKLLYIPSYIQFNMLYMSTLNLKPIGATVTMSLGLLADCYIAI